MTAEILKPDRITAKYKLSSMGLADGELTKPLIAIIYEDGCEGLLNDIKYGASVSDCSAVALCLPSLNDLTAAGQSKNMMLFARESIADITETLLGIYSADAVVLVGESESCCAGMLLGAVRKNVPLVFLPAEIKGRYYPKTVLTTKAAVSCGKKSLSKIDVLENSLSLGRSVEMDNLNSLCVFCEGAGLSVLGVTSAHTVNDRIIYARESGRLAAIRAQKLSYPRKDLSLKSFVNGLAVQLASGGTIASLLHIIAIARANDLDVSFDFIADLSAKIPLLCDVAPAGKYDILDFGRAGGVVTVLRELANIHKLLNPATRCGEMLLSDILAGAPVQNGNEVIKTLSVAKEESGISIIKGNIAEGGLFRKNAGDKTFKGKAFVCENEEMARGAILSGAVAESSVLVIKGQSARDNGMPLLDIESALAAKDLKNVIILTDGRTLELWVNTVISLVDKTEAFDVLSTGDTIEIDFKKGRINLDLSPKELNARLKKHVSDTVQTGSLLRYTSLVLPASMGCALKHKL